MDAEGKKMVGIITLSDLIRGIDREQAIDAKVERYMTNNVIIVSPEIHLYEVIKQFKEQHIGRVIIMENEKPTGILTQSDIIKVFPAL